MGMVEYGAQEDVKATATNSKGEIVEIITQSLLIPQSQR